VGRSKPRSKLGGTQVGPGTVVALSYELYDADGELVGASHPAEPWVVVIGYGQSPPALEAALSGLVAGQARKVRLDVGQAFGPRDAEAIIEVARDELPEDLQVGDELEAEAEAGGVAVTLKVLEITDDLAVLDANHPMAGQPVELDVVVEDVRPATSDELEAAEAAIQRDPPDRMQTLLPADRLLKRSLR
jgi:FKBP-type peptidyl-prolyl cis-trans isomerase SlyD